MADATGLNVGRPRDQSFQDVARQLVFDYVKARLEKADSHVTFGPDEVYIVWACFVLGCWKVLISTTLPDGMYYEVTHDRDKITAYIDAYRKWENVEVALEATENIS